MPSQNKEQALINWTAPARPFKKRSKEFYVNMIAMASLIGVILFLIEGFMPILLMISLLFLFYVMSTIEPGKIEYKITNFGVYIENTFIPWSQMGRFWFANRFGNEILIIETNNILNRSELIINPENKEKIKTNLAKYLVHEQAPPSLLDKMVDSGSRLMPK